MGVIIMKRTIQIEIPDTLFGKLKSWMEFAESVHPDNFVSIEHLLIFALNYIRKRNVVKLARNNRKVEKIIHRHFEKLNKTPSPRELDAFAKSIKLSVWFEPPSVIKEITSKKPA